MAMSNYILRYRGPGAIPVDHLERIRKLTGVDVIDTTPRMLLVKGPGEQLKSLINTLPDWVLSEEKIIYPPDPRPKLR